MGLSVYPTPSTSSAPYVGATTLVAADTTTKGWYSTSLAAGSYIITALTGGNMGFTSNGHTPNNPNFSYSLYNNNIKSTYQWSGSPVYIKLTTSDTLFMGSSWNWGPDPQSGTTYYYAGNAVQNGNNFGRWTKKNSNSTKLFGVGHTGSNHYTITFPYIGPNYNPISTSGNAGTNFAQFAYAGTNLATVYGYMGNKYLIGTTGGSVYQSTDTVTWANPTITGLSGGIKDFCFGSSINNYYVVTTNSSTANANLASSTDGVTWTTRGSVVAQPLYAVTAGTSLYCAVGGGGSIITSTDTITWSSRTSPQTGNDWNQVAFNNGRFLAISNYVNSGFSAAYSTNGTTWTGTNILINKASENVGTFLGNDWRTAVAYLIPGGDTNSNNSQQYIWTGDGYFYLQYGANIFVSTDAISWGTINQGFMGGYQTLWHPTYGLIQVEIGGNVAKFGFPSTTTYVVYNSIYP